MWEEETGEQAESALVFSGAVWPLYIVTITRLHRAATGRHQEGGREGQSWHNILTERSLVQPGLAS